MGKKIIIIALSLITAYSFGTTHIANADDLKNNDNIKEFTEKMNKEKRNYEELFKKNFNNDIVEINQGDTKITLDGDMSDWVKIPYLEDEDKYGPHSENLKGMQYFIDKKDSVDGKPYLYIKINMENARHIRIWGVKNKDTYDKFNEYYNQGGNSETRLISLLEGDKAGVVSYNVNVERLSESEKIRVQVLNNNAKPFKEQGYFVDENSSAAEFRIPLEELVSVDGSANFDLIIGTDLYNYPTADFMNISLSSGSTGPILGLALGVTAVVILSIKLKK